MAEGQAIKATTGTIDLGPVSEVTSLFSYPPNFNSIFLLTKRGTELSPTLEKTVELYVNASLKRDGYSDSQATASILDGHVHLEISGETTGKAATAAYATVLSQFMSIGRIGLARSEENARLTLTTKDALWRYNWRFFLPLGLPMVNHKSVQLLHFPPDSVLSKDQDYLAASTTRRWASLLVANGAAAQETDSYQTIVDAAPISAPHADGANVTTNVCISYTEYIVGLLEAWLPRPDGRSRPMVSFGTPVRQWLQHTFGTGDLKVRSLVQFKLKSGLAVSTVIANHPSMIFNLDDDLTDDPNTPVDDRLCPLIPTMQDDLIAAGWQVAMAQDPDADPGIVLKKCEDTWTHPDKTPEICQLIYEQVFNMEKKEAATRIEKGELPKCAQEIVTEPEGQVAMQQRETANKVAEKLGGRESMLREQLYA